MAKLNFMAAVGASALIIAGVAATPSAAQYRADRDYERGDDRDDSDRGGYDRNRDDRRYGGDRDDRRGGYDGALTSSYVDSLEWRINNAANQGQISRGHAQQLMREYRQVQESAHRVQTGQASRRERDRLAAVVQRIEAATTQRGRQGRAPRYGYNNR